MARACVEPRHPLGWAGPSAAIGGYQRRDDVCHFAALICNNKWHQYLFCDHSQQWCYFQTVCQCLCSIIDAFHCQPTRGTPDDHMNHIRLRSRLLPHLPDEHQAPRLGDKNVYLPTHCGTRNSLTTTEPPAGKPVWHASAANSYPVQSPKTPALHAACHRLTSQSMPASVPTTCVRINGNNSSNTHPPTMHRSMHMTTAWHTAHLYLLQAKRPTVFAGCYYPACP